MRLALNSDALRLLLGIAQVSEDGMVFIEHYPDWAYDAERITFTTIVGDQKLGLTRLDANQMPERYRAQAFASDLQSAFKKAYDHDAWTALVRAGRGE